jgi:hypothetical protein
MKIPQKLDRHLSLGQKHGNTLRQPANRQRFRSLQPIGSI